MMYRYVVMVIARFCDSIVPPLDISRIDAHPSNRKTLQYIPCNALFAHTHSQEAKKCLSRAVIFVLMYQEGCRCRRRCIPPSWITSYSSTSPTSVMIALVIRCRIISDIFRMRLVSLSTATLISIRVTAQFRRRGTCARQSIAFLVHLVTHSKSQVLLQNVHHPLVSLSLLLLLASDALLAACRLPLLDFLDFASGRSDGQYSRTSKTRR